MIRSLADKIMKYIAPRVHLPSFTCPHCGAIAQQHWWNRTWDAAHLHPAENNALHVSKCLHCNGRTLWIEDRMYFPDTGSAPVPNPELPEEVKKLYLEA